jgi:hypothetical protein
MDLSQLAATVNFRNELSALAWTTSNPVPCAHSNIPGTDLWHPSVRSLAILRLEIVLFGVRDDPGTCRP